MADERPWLNGEFINADDVRKEFALQTEAQMFILWELASQNLFPTLTVENTGYSLEVGSMGSTLDSGSSFNFKTTEWVGTELLNKLVFVESYDENNDSSVDTTRWFFSGGTTENASQLTITVATAGDNADSESLLASGANGIDYKTLGVDSLTLFNAKLTANRNENDPGDSARAIIQISDGVTSVVLGSIAREGGTGGVGDNVITDEFMVKFDISAGSAYFYSYDSQLPINTLSTPGSVDINGLGSWFLRFEVTAEGDDGDDSAAATIEIDFVRVNRGDETASFNFTTVIQDKNSNAQTGFGYFLGSAMDTSSIAISNDAGIGSTLLDSVGSFTDFGTTGSQMKVIITGSLPPVSDPTVGSVNLPYITNWGLYAFRK